MLQLLSWEEKIKLSQLGWVETKQCWKEWRGGPEKGRNLAENRLQAVKKTEVQDAEFLSKEAKGKN